MRNLLEQARQLNSLRRLIGWEMLETALQSRLRTEILDRPESGKVLILAPHPGDEVLGCGGAIALHREQGDEVRILTLCDGRSGTKRRVTELVREELKKTRRKETIAAAEILGIASEELTFWDYQDDHLEVNKTTIKALTQILADFVPAIIYFPHPAEIHRDHRIAAALVAETLRAMGGEFPAELMAYELDQPLFANRLLLIESVIAQKEQAIRAHQSQFKRLPIDETTLALNLYRGGRAGLSGHAEAFLALRPKLYLQLWDLLRGVS